MSGFIQGEDRTQATLFPERLDDWIAEDSPVRVIDVFIDELDLAGLGFRTQPNDTGRPAYHPSTMLKLFVYGYLNSLQLTLGWVPWETGDDSTYLGIATSANSDYLTGFVGKMIRVLGANKGAEMVGGVLSEIRDDLEAGVDPTDKYEQ